MVFHVCDAPGCETETNPPAKLCPRHTSRLAELVEEQMAEDRKHRAAYRARKRAERKA